MPDQVRHGGVLGMVEHRASVVPSCCHTGLEPVSRASGLEACFDWAR